MRLTFCLCQQFGVVACSLSVDSCTNGPPKSTMKDSKTTPASTPAASVPAVAPTPLPAAVDPTATSTHRLHLGGFRDTITSADISSRFSSFGQVTDVVIPITETGLPRGFAHFSLTATHAQYTRLLSVYNGTKWKGGVISLHPAKPRPADVRQADRDRIAEKERARVLNFGPDSKDEMPLDGGWPAWQRAQAQLRRRARRGALEGKHVGYINEVMADDAKHLDLAGKHRLWKRVKFGRCCL
ncbi:hypothetical protein BCR44DRAFT_1191003 [Catenaria anguillulae PL171]|uniref:RRM domain-containing protein n=1 Tax=Catenaria anguillulae PL171 TaxID=765915 RepID=A0A1Y2HIV0_9FUNG|nr:hypothetical protein BCR44DRAFT_1191003 [Catenaria anguillulae PL171]